MNKIQILGLSGIATTLIPFCLYKYPICIYVPAPLLHPIFSLISVFVLIFAFYLSNYSFKLTWWFLVFLPLALLPILFYIFLFCIWSRPGGFAP